MAKQKVAGAENNQLYQIAWNTLAMVFGEQMNNEALETIEAVLKSVKADLEDSKPC